jgi:hypothetical protein
MCVHDLALYWDGKKYRWRCYKCGKFIEEIPKRELDKLDIMLLKEGM